MSHVDWVVMLQADWVVMLQADWVVMNYVPIAEAVLKIVVELYSKSAVYASVVSHNVLLQIIQVRGWSSMYSYKYMYIISKTPPYPFPEPVTLLGTCSILRLNILLLGQKLDLFLRIGLVRAFPR